MKSVIVDNRISYEEEESLKAYNYNIIKCPACNHLYDAVSSHPDMLMNKLDDGRIIVYRDIEETFIEESNKLNINIIKSKNKINEKYPYDIALNGVNLSNTFVHLLKYTDPVLAMETKDKKLINVKQGYTKCSTAVISESAIITSDKGIAAALYKENFDVLLIPPGDIVLPGLDYGFIGGACGLLEKGLIAFYGSLDNYIYGAEVMNFLKKHKVEPLFLSKGKIIDRGSIFVL